MLLNRRDDLVQCLNDESDILYYSMKHSKQIASYGLNTLNEVSALTFVLKWSGISKY